MIFTNEHIFPGNCMHVQHSVDKSYHLMSIRLSDTCFTEHIPPNSSYDAREKNNEVFIKCSPFCILIALMMKTIANMSIQSHLKFLTTFMSQICENILWGSD